MGEEFEEGKEVEDYLAELDKLTIEPPKKEKVIIEPVIEQSVPKIEPTVQHPSAPQIIPEPKPHVEPSTPPIQDDDRPSFDKIANTFLEKQYEQIDNEALEKKEQVRHAFNNRLSSLFLGLTDGSVSTPQAPQIQVAVPLVKDNSDEIRWIDNQLFNDDIPNKLPLIKRKRQLEGKPLSQDDIAKFSPTVSSKKVNDEKPKKEYSVKVGLALFGLTALITTAIFYVIFFSGLIK